MPQTLSETLDFKAANQELINIAGMNPQANRQLQLVKADLRNLTVAEYVLIESAICITKP
jgi:hypothetical protein